MKTKISDIMVPPPPGVMACRLQIVLITGCRGLLRREFLPVNTTEVNHKHKQLHSIQQCSAMC